MKICFLSLLAFLTVFLTSCNTIQVRPDEAPAPVDPSIHQERIEFSGCGVDSQIGTIVCLPGQIVSVVTEFAGDVIYFSTDQECSLRQQVRATPPLTQVQLPTAPKVCDVSILYVPEYVGQGKSTQQIYGMEGEITMMPDASYQPLGNFEQSIAETLKLQFPGIVSGIYIGRQMSDVARFTGDTMEYKPTIVGNDLVYLKLTLSDGTVQQRVIPGNYYSANALDLLFDIQTTGKNITLTFPQEVSVVTATGYKITSKLTVVLKPTFTGYVRAYTAKGRTVVAYFEDGDLKWKR